MSHGGPKPPDPPASAQGFRRGRAPRRRSRAGSSGTVAAGTIARLISLAEAQGVSGRLLLDAAGIASGQLQDPDARLPLAAEIAIWQTLAQRADPACGVRAGTAFRVRSMGLVGYVAYFSATLRQALRHLQRYGRIFTEAVEFKLEEGPPDVALAICHPSLGSGQAIAQDFRLAAALQACRDLTGVAVVPVEASFTYAQPPSTLTHREHFRCPLRFGAPSAQLVFHSRDLDLPTLRGDETLAGLLSRYAEQLLTTLLQGHSTQHTVRAVLWSLLADGEPSLARVAAVLGMSPRTLQRRLASEGTSVAREIENIRRTMAVALLRDPGLPIADIAFLLGYSESSTFFRSFKRWTGTTPHRFRRLPA